MGLYSFAKVCVPLAGLAALSYYLASEPKQKQIVARVTKRYPVSADENVHNQNFKTMITKKYNPAIQKEKKNE